MSCPFIYYAVLPPFLHVRPLSARHPSAGDESAEIKRLADRIKEEEDARPAEEQLESPELVKAAIAATQ